MKERVFMFVLDFEKVMKLANEETEYEPIVFHPAALRDLAEIRIGDPVVHEAHGIGRYMGLVSIDLGEGETEMMQLEYAEGATLYVPVLNVIEVNLPSRPVTSWSRDTPLESSITTATPGRAFTPSRVTKPLILPPW